MLEHTISPATMKRRSPTGRYFETIDKFAKPSIEKRALEMVIRTNSEFTVLDSIALEMRFGRSSQSRIIVRVPMEFSLPYDFFQ